MSAVSAPPGMQPWIRQTDATLKDMHGALTRLERSVNAIESARQYLPVAATVLDTITAPEGVNAAWDLAGTGLGPDVVVTTLTGQIVVTLSAYMTATWEAPTEAAQAYGAMTVSVYGPLTTGDFTGAAQQGAARAFSYVSGQPTTEDDTVSSVIVLKVPPGTYTLRSEYLYQNFTEDIRIKWSNRTLIAEPR